MERENHTFYWFCWLYLINKIEKVSKETAEKIKTIQSSVKPFLPVIISGTEKDLN